MIAVHAENLEPFRPTSSLKVFVEFRAAQSAELVTMLLAVVVHVVNAEKEWFGFTATCATVSAVSHDGFMLLAEIIVARCQLAFLGIVLHPAIDPV